jgi:putative ATP-binding cassette transporter
MELFGFLFRTSRRLVWLAILASVVSGLGTVGVLVIARRWLRGSEAPHAGLVLAFAGVCLAALTAKLGAQLLLVVLTRKAVARLTLRLSEHILAAPLQTLEDLGPGRLQAALTQDVQALGQGLNAVPVTCANGALVAACVIYLCALSLPAFGLLAVPLGAGLTVQWLLHRRARQYFFRTREGQEALVGNLRHLAEGLKELKLNRPRREAFLRDCLRPGVEHQERQGAASRFYLALAATWGRLLFFAVIGFLLLGLPALLPDGREVVGGYLLATFFLMQPLGGLQQVLPQFGRAQASLARLQALGLDLAAAEEAKPDPAEPIRGWDRLELTGVAYTYRRERDEKGFTLGPLDLTFRPGELVFLGGGNGSGKTTFAKLLAGLYAPQRGEVRLDGQAVADARRESYRQLFAVVFSECHLFPGLLGLGGPEGEATAREYLERFHLDHKVGIRDGVFSTTTALSRGQQKRLALLIAYLEDRPFYVFDEWAADQDPHFKEIFYRQILPDLKARGKAVLVITHDDRYYPLADRLLLLEDGKLRQDAAGVAFAS